MSMKSIGGLVLAGALVWLGWYLLVRPYEFQITFKSKALPGSIDQTLRRWEQSKNNSKTLSLDVSSFEHEVREGDHVYQLMWEYQRSEDSVTKVIVRISEPGKEVANKLLIPFSSTPLERTSEQLVREFIFVLGEYLKKTKVEVVGESTLDARLCVCASLNSSQLEKAYGMMEYYGLLGQFIIENHLQMDGLPIIMVKDWDRVSGSLSYQFCYPILEVDSLPPTDYLEYQQLPSQRVIKAIYLGNYITSDRAWYALQAYADQHQLEVTGNPIEVFHNNPNFGGNELSWKADVYLPIK